MGCRQCTSNQRPRWDVNNKKISFLAPTLHYSLNFVPQSAYLNSLDSEDLKTVYKVLLTPFQLQMRSCSSLKSLDTTLSSDSKGNSLEGIPSDFHSELMSASRNWPLNISESLFVFVNGGKNLKLSVITTGGENTPYAHGLFHFDVTFENSSFSRPQIIFVANSDTQVSFGPQLNKNEKIQDLVLSKTTAESLIIQDGIISGIISRLHDLVKNNSFWEIEIEEARPECDENEKRRLLKAQENIIKCNTIMYAMLEYIRNPAPWMRDLVHTYFYLKRDVVIKQCRKWLLAAQTDDGLYEHLQAIGERQDVSQLSDGRYFEKLKKLIKELEKEISRINIHIDSPIIAALEETEKEKASEEGSPVSSDSRIIRDFDPIENVSI